MTHSKDEVLVSPDKNLLVKLEQAATVAIARLLASSYNKIVNNYQNNLAVA